jgi:signal transduction histidine kinase
LLFAVVLLVAAAVSSADLRWRPLTLGVLGVYALYSLGLLVAVRFMVSLGRGSVLAIHLVDLGVAAALAMLVDVNTSSLLVLFSFVLLAAGYRWGLWETLLTGIAGVTVVSGQALVSLSATRAGSVPYDLALEPFFVRIGYLALFAVMIGSLAERHRTSRADLALTVAAAERARLARELHDGVIQSLIAIKMRIEVLRRSLSEDSTAISELQENEAMLAHEVINLRMLMFDLAPANETPAELSSQLNDLVERFHHGSGIDARFVAAGAVSRASARVGHEISRIVQESLVNAYKHSGARHVLVTLSEKSDRWELTVEDDGRGFDFEGRASDADLIRASKGPRVLMERVRLLGGSLTIDSRPGEGATLTVTLPLRM